MKCFGQKKNTVETYFTTSSLQRRDSFPGIQGKLDLITPKVNTVFEFNIIDTGTRQCEQWTSINILTDMMHTLFYPLCAAIRLTYILH